MIALVIALQLFFSNPFIYAGKAKSQEVPSVCASALLTEDQRLEVIHSQLDKLIRKAPPAYRVALEILRQGLEEQAFEKCQQEENCTREQVARITKQTLEKKQEQLRVKNSNKFERFVGYSKIAAPVMLSLALSTLWLHSLPEHPSATQQFISELVHLTTTLVVFTFGAPLTSRIYSKIKRLSFRTLDPEPLPPGVLVHTLADFDRIDIDVNKGLPDDEQLARDALMSAVRGVDGHLSLALDIGRRAKPEKLLDPQDLKLYADRVATALMFLRIANPSIAPDQKLLLDNVYAAYTWHERHDLRCQIYPIVLERLKARDPDAKESREVFKYYEQMLRGLLFLPDEEKP